MKKIPVLFKTADKGTKDYKALPELREGAEWVLTTDCEISRKYDGTACAIIGGVYYKRFELKHGRNLPDGAIACSELDPVTGSQMYWVPVLDSDVWHWKALRNCATRIEDLPDLTYELIGPKINQNREGFDRHVLVAHGADIVQLDLNTDPYTAIRDYLMRHDIEGLVFRHRLTGEMYKVRKWDEFRIPRNQVIND